MGIHQNDLTTAPLVTVIIPTYQHAAFIEQCLVSVLEQRTSFAVEILIGEDGSTDGTREICLKLQERYPDRIRVLLRDRSRVVRIDGAPTGRANVIDLYQQARGRFIAICEGDDRWCDPGKLQLQVDLLLQDPTASASYHDTAIMDASGERTGKLFRAQLPDQFDRRTIVGLWAPFHVSSFVFRNERSFDRPRKWYWRTGVFDMVLLVLMTGHGRLVRVPGVMSEYRKTGEGITTKAHNTGPRLHRHRIYMWWKLEDQCPFLDEADVRPVVSAHFALLCKEFGRHAAMAQLRVLFGMATWSMLKRPGLSWSFVRAALRAPSWGK